MPRLNPKAQPNIAGRRKGGFRKVTARGFGAARPAAAPVSGPGMEEAAGGPDLARPETSQITNPRGMRRMMRKNLKGMKF